MQTRKQKIEFLKDLSKGKKTLKDLPVFRVEIWTNDCQAGYLRNMMTGLILPEKQVEDRIRNRGENTIAWIEEKTYE
jgi:hypothetical protein